MIAAGILIFEKKLLQIAPIMIDRLKANELYE